MANYNQPFAIKAAAESVETAAKSQCYCGYSALVRLGDLLGF